MLNAVLPDGGRTISSDVFISTVAKSGLTNLQLR
jgi:hypothetical protein